MSGVATAVFRFNQLDPRLREDDRSKGKSLLTGKNYRYWSC
jgi:hypothetical protein